MYGIHNRTPESNVAAVQWLELQPADRFLDLGCGLGAALELASKTGVAEVAGVDPSPAMVERASARVTGARVEVGSAEGIPFPDGAFTAVMTVSAFHHWADRAAGMTEVLRVLAPGGRLLIVERKTRPGERHGLDDAAAAVVESELKSAGFPSTRVEEKRVGRKDYVAVLATSPE